MVGREIPNTKMRLPMIRESIKAFVYLFIFCTKCNSIGSNASCDSMNCDNFAHFLHTKMALSRRRGVGEREKGGGGRGRRYAVLRVEM